MTLSEYSDTYSWQGALDLGPRLLSLADELPASESMGLSFHLHQLAVELPASIAARLLAGDPADMSVMLKLIATLELVERVYPALDVSPVKRQADELAARLAGDGFSERPQAAPIELPASIPDSEEPAQSEAAPDAPIDAADTQITFAPSVDSVAPAQPQPMPQVSPAEPAPYNVPIQPNQPLTPTNEESDVQPDSRQ